MSLALGHQLRQVASSVSANVGSYVLLTLACLVAYYAVTAVMAWWPLRHFPAPSPLAHFSSLYHSRNAVAGRHYWLFRHLHAGRGPIVRIGPRMLVTDDPTIMKSIWMARPAWWRDSWYETGRFNPYHDVMFSVLDPARHSKMKAKRAAAYGGRDVPEVEPQVDGQVGTLIDLLRRKYAARGPQGQLNLLDLGTLTNFFTMDVITKLAFGQEFGYLRDEQDHYNFMGSLKPLWPTMALIAETAWLRRILFSTPVLKLIGPKNTDKEGFGALMAVAEHHVGKRFAPDAKVRRDMLGSFISHGLNQKECEVEGLFMIVAGSESTASAMRSCLVHTITCPPVYSRLKQEMAEAVADGRVSNPIRLDEARRLPYLQAVIYEGIRMRPPLLGLFPKVVPAGGVTINGQFVPAGTAMCVNTSSMMRNRDLFGHDADVFRPGRFTDLSPTARADMERHVEMAFGQGQYMCVGKNIALMDLNKAVFEILRNFDLQLIEPARPCEVDSYSIFLEHGMMVKVTENVVG